MDAMNMTFTDNSARKRGGSLVAIEESKFSLTNSSFTGNQAAIGSAIYGENMYETTFNLTGVNFTSNSATQALI